MSPAGASLQLVPNSQFTILSPSYPSHNCPCGSYPIAPQFTIQNSQFRIHNSLPVPQFIIPFATSTLTHPITPIALIAPTAPQFRIQNSKFIIQNRCKGKIFLLYCQDVVPLHLEVTEKIGIIK